MPAHPAPGGRASVGPLQLEQMDLAVRAAAVAADGTLGGYGGGTDRKVHLLELERAHRS